MVLLNKINPYKNIGPGTHIQELIEIRDWTQQDLADVLGVSAKHVNKLLNDEQPITLNMAKLLGEAFDLSPQYWINLDTNYRLRLEEETNGKTGNKNTACCCFYHCSTVDLVCLKIHTDNRFT